MKALSLTALLPLLLATSLQSQTEDDRHWFYDYGGPDGEAFEMQRAGNYLYTFGGFLSLEGDAHKKNLGRFNLTSETWEGVPGIDRNFSNFVRCATVDQNGNLWFGGDFVTIGGVAALKVAKFDPRTETWSALEDPTLPSSDSIGPSGGGVRAITRAGDYVYIGGFIFNHEDKAWRYIRRYHIPTQRWETVGGGLNDTVDDLETDANGNVYASGSFTATVTDGKPLAGVAKWDGQSWEALGAGITGGAAVVRDLVLDAEGNLYAGGQFTNAGGKPANNVALWSDGTWDVMNGGIIGGGNVGGIYGMAVDSKGRLYVGGDFDAAGTSDQEPLNKVAVWDGSGQWQALGSGLGLSTTQIVNGVHAIGEDVYFTGVFSKGYERPNTKKNFALWNPNIDFTDYLPGVRGLDLGLRVTREGNDYKVSHPTISGQTYYLESSADMVNWSTSNSFNGNNRDLIWTFPSNGSQHYFRVKVEG